MRQKERRERSREEIYQAALEEFGTYGYDRVNMERICGKHGISKGMMYHYYANKDALFLLCVERTFSALESYVAAHAADLAGKDVLEDIKNYFLIREHFFEENLRQNHSSDGGFGLRFGDVQLPTGVVHGFADLQSAGAEG